GVRCTGAQAETGCKPEGKAELADPALKQTGPPKTTQSCPDGDPACDSDAGNDGRCTFRARLCLRAQAPRLPDCTPGAIDSVKMKWPLPLSPDDATDAANASVLRDPLTALAVTVKQATTVLHPAMP